MRDAIRGGTEANCGCYFKKFLNQTITEGLGGLAPNAISFALAACPVIENSPVSCVNSCSGKVSDWRCLRCAVTSTDIDRAAGRLVHAMIRLGQLDEEGMTSEYTQIPTSEVASAAHQQLALEAVRQSLRPPTIGVVLAAVSLCNAHFILGQGVKVRNGPGRLSRV